MQNQFRTAQIEELRVSESIPIGLKRAAITLVDELDDARAAEKLQERQRSSLQHGRQDDAA